MSSHFKLSSFEGWKTMNKKGFLLVEVLMGLFLLGIVSITCLPILNTALNNLRLVENKMDMTFIAESTIEQLKAFNYNQHYENEYLFDMKLTDLIFLLKGNDVAQITLPLEEPYSPSPYRCTIYKENRGDKLWQIEVEVSHSKEEKINNIRMVTIMVIPEPEKK